MEVPSTLVAALPWLQWLIIIMLIFVSGIAWCFNFWVIPIIKLNGSVSALAQFQETSRRGGAWLEPLNTALAVSLAAAALLVSQHPDPTEAATERYYAAAAATIVQVAWWERVLIFPLDDCVAAMKDDKENFKTPESNWLTATSQAGLKRSMDSWARRHAVRATLPFLAAMIALLPKIRL